MWDDAVIPGAPTAIVTTGNLNIRTGPGASFATITSVPYGTTLTLVGRNADGTWVKVRTSSGQEGWANASYLTTSVPVSSLPIVDGSTGTGTPTAVVTTGALNVRSGSWPQLQFRHSCLSRLTTHPDWPKCRQQLGESTHDPMAQKAGSTPRLFRQMCLSATCPLSMVPHHQHNRLPLTQSSPQVRSMFALGQAPLIPLSQLSVRERN